MTAVEWFEKIRQGQKVQPFDDYEWEIAFNHAKEMEKEQIETAFEEGMFHHTNGLCPDEYYEETYKIEEL
jgi:hypothetical protein